MTDSDRIPARFVDGPWDGVQAQLRYAPVRVQIGGRLYYRFGHDGELITYRYSPTPPDPKDWIPSAEGLVQGPIPSAPDRPTRTAPVDEGLAGAVRAWGRAAWPGLGSVGPSAVVGILVLVAVLVVTVLVGS